MTYRSFKYKIYFSTLYQHQRPKRHNTYKQQAFFKVTIRTTTNEFSHSDTTLLPLAKLSKFKKKTQTNFGLEPFRLLLHQLLPQRLARLLKRPAHPPPQDDAVAIRPVLYRVVDPLYQLLAFNGVTEEVGAAFGAVLQAVFQQAAVIKGG